MSGLVFVIVGCLAATDRLPRNKLAGIRIPSTMRNDEAWRRGHRAAASALTIAGIGPLVAAAASQMKSSDTDAQTALRRVGDVWLLGWLGIATVQAHRSATRDVV